MRLPGFNPVLTSGLDLLITFLVVPDSTPSCFVNKFLVSKETVVLRRWESETGKFGFINHVDKGRITTVNDLES